MCFRSPALIFDTFNIITSVDDVSDMDLNTGPSYSGTRRFVGKDNADSSNSTIHEADVVLISASGNHVGHMVHNLFHNFISPFNLWLYL